MICEDREIHCASHCDTPSARDMTDTSGNPVQSLIHYRDLTKTQPGMQPMYFIIYRSRDPNLRKAKRWRIMVLEISSHLHYIARYLLDVLGFG